MRPSTSVDCLTMFISTELIMIDKRIRFGAWTEGMDRDPSLLDEAANKIGANMEIASIFRGKGDEWPYPVDERLGENRELLVSWHLEDFGDFKHFYSGQADEMLVGQARRVANYSGPVIIRPWAEMNADWVDFQPTGLSEEAKQNGGNYAEFEKAWRHVVNIFRQEGTENVKWAFNPTTDTYDETAPIDRYYPGDDVVDMVALDGYNWGDGGGLTWRSFEDIYAQQYANLQAVAPEKSVMIAEIGSADTTSGVDCEKGITAPRGQTKGDWWYAAARSLNKDFTNVDALVLFDTVKERDWRIDSSHMALEGLRTAVRELQSRR